MKILSGWIQAVTLRKVKGRERSVKGRERSCRFRLGGSPVFFLFFIFIEIV